MHRLVCSPAFSAVSEAFFDTDIGIRTTWYKIKVNTEMIENILGTSRKTGKNTRFSRNYTNDDHNHIDVVYMREK